MTTYTRLEGRYARRSPPPLLNPSWDAKGGEAFTRIIHHWEDGMASHFEPATSQDGKRTFGWKRIMDITLPLHDGMAKPSPAFEGFRLHWDLRMEKGQGRNRSRFSMESHMGTHVDAPVHFIRDGKNIDQVPVENLFGTAGVVQVPFPEAATADFLGRVKPGPEILLFKFGHVRLDRKWPYFSPDGAKALSRQGNILINSPRSPFS